METVTPGITISSTNTITGRGMNRNEDYTKSADWLRFRRHYLRDHKPTDEGYYLCGICGHWVNANEVTLDHIEPRTASNMFDPNNIQPAHWTCNDRKGSRRWKTKVSKEEYKFLTMLTQL